MDNSVSCSVILSRPCAWSPQLSRSERETKMRLPYIELICPVGHPIPCNNFLQCRRTLRCPPKPRCKGSHRPIPKHESKACPGRVCSGHSLQSRQKLMMQHAAQGWKCSVLGMGREATFTITGKANSERCIQGKLVQECACIFSIK